MVRWRLVAALVAVWVTIAVGAWDALQRPRERAPRWSPALHPLVTAPIPAGEAVALALPSDLNPTQRDHLLFEATWQRPDLRWSLLARWPPEAPLRRVVALPGADVPPGWRDIWQSGDVRVMTRESP
ncbi:MAG: hypothetical protein ACM3O7_01070 [Acidobacteriota bacterium]